MEGQQVVHDSPVHRACVCSFGLVTFLLLSSYVLQSVAFDYKLCVKWLKVPPQDDLVVDIMDPFLHRVVDESAEAQLLLKLEC